MKKGKTLHEALGIPDKRAVELAEWFTRCEWALKEPGKDITLSQVIDLFCVRTQTEAEIRWAAFRAGVYCEEEGLLRRAECSPIGDFSKKMEAAIDELLEKD